jgi:amphi-Trp domain-containing protein
MGAEKILFESEERKDIDEVAGFLRQVADKLQQGALTLKRDANEVHLSFPPAVILELKAEEEMKKSGKKYSFEIEIEWIEGGEGQTQIA